MKTDQSSTSKGLLTARNFSEIFLNDEDGKGLYIETYFDYLGMSSVFSFTSIFYHKLYHIIWSICNFGCVSNTLSKGEASKLLSEVGPSI